MPDNNVLFFEVSANLQKLIGEELISNENIAFMELVKNSYDSGAKNVYIEIHYDSPSAKPFIVIRDDGEGMTLPQFKRTFMLAGQSERNAAAHNAARIPTGEKGIGRFAADKIGSELILTTKAKEAQRALRVTFDWNKFRQKGKKFGEIEAPYSFVAPPVSLSRSGTLLVINQLRSKWDAAKTLSLKSSLRSLLNPYASEHESFKIHFSTFGTRQSDEIIVAERLSQADYEIQFKVTAEKLLLRLFRSPRDRKRADWKQVVGPKVDNLVGLKGRLYYYIKKPSRDMSKGLPTGVQVYRDGFIMQPFGTPISDRLKLLEKRAKRAGHAPLVPNRIFGFVEISRLTHPSLRDTTGRQDMLETEELHELVMVLKAQTDFLEENLLEEVQRPSWQRSAGAKSILLEQARLNSLGNLSVGIGHEIRQPLQVIISFADAIDVRLQTLRMKDKEIAGSLERINDAADRIDKTITFIKQLSAGDLEDITTFDLAALTKRELKLFETQNEDIEFTTSIPAKQFAKTNETTVIHVLANLVKNSVEAIRDVQDDRPGRISVSLERKGNLHILEVSDNGVGIQEEDKPRIFKKFSTKKTGGLGFGLTYCRTILESQGDKISFRSNRGAETVFHVEISEKDG